MTRAARTVHRREARRRGNPESTLPPRMWGLRTPRAGTGPLSAPHRRTRTLRPRAELERHPRGVCHHEPPTWSGARGGPGRRGDAPQGRRGGSRRTSPGEQRADRGRQRPRDATDSRVEQGLEVGRRQPVRRGGNGRWRHRYGCTGGEGSGGYGIGGNAPDRPPRGGTAGAETRWTSWSAVGCNKPMERPAAQTVEVGRNHEDGPRTRWLRVPRRPAREAGWGAPVVMSMERTFFAQPWKELGTSRATRWRRRLRERGAHG